MKKATRTLALLLTLCTLLSCLSLFASADSTIGNISTEQMIIPPTAEQAAAAVSATAYSIAPNHIIPFIFDGAPPFDGLNIDTGNFTEGFLYVYDSIENSVTQITDAAVSNVTATKDHLFYSSANGELYQSDFTGSYHTLLMSLSPFLHMMPEWQHIVNIMDIQPL